ncbi:unnamed protein product [Prunus brigantina]
MGKSSVSPIDLLHNASNYITLKLDDTNYMQWSYRDMILLILKGLPVEYNPFKSHIRARPVRVTLPELRDLLLEEECDLDAAAKSFNSPIMTAMVAQKGTVSSSPPVAHGDNFHSGGGGANPNWQPNWNRRSNYRGRGSWSRGRSWNNGGRGNTWNNSGPNWNGSPNQWNHNHGGQSGNSYGHWNQGSGSWNNNTGFNNNGGFNNNAGFSNASVNNPGSWHSTGGPWHPGGNSGSSPQYFVSPNSSPGVLSPSPTAPPISTVTSSPATETCQICLLFGHTAPNCPQRTNFSYQGAPPSPALTALTATANGAFSDPNIWLTDSGATNHMTSDIQLLSNVTPSTSTDNVTIGNGTGLRIANVGSSSLVSGHQVFHLPEVLHVPTLATNLLSVHRFCLDNNCQILYNALWFQIQDLQGRVLYQGQCHNGLYPLPTRTPSLFPSLAAFHGHKFATSIKTFQSDGGGEFVSKDFQTYLGSKGILHHKSCPYTPEQNGRAERKHRHLVETAVTLLTTAALPSKYLFHALSTANYLINRMPCKSLGYLCLVPKTDRIYISRHVVFDESCFPFKSSSSPPDSTTPMAFTPLRPHLSSRSFLHSARNPRLDGLPEASSSTNQLASPVSNEREVVSSVDVIDSSAEFVQDELLPIQVQVPTESSPQSATLSSSPAHASDQSPSLDLIVDLPAPPINSHPMQTRSKSGIVKSRHGFLAAKSTSDPSPFHEPQTYSQAAKVSEWRHAMVDEFQALAKQHTWTLVPYQPTMNIVGCKWVFKLKKNADGSISRHKARLVAKGFHQEAGLDYDETFSPVVKHSTVRLVLALAAQFHWSIKQLDVKNAFLHGVLHEEQTIIALSREFDMKDLGQLTYFLGLQVQYTSMGIHVNQSKYATDLLLKACMTQCKPCSTPCLPTAKLLKFDGTPLSDPTLYRSLVGGLQYLTFSRPDIAFAVNTLCQFMHTPTDTHFAAVKRVLRYLAGTLTHGIHFTSSDVHLQAYSDADWAGDSTVSRSSTEAEYRALAITAAELSWLRQILRDLHIVLDRPPVLWCDNISALALASNPVFHARTKHIEIDFHFIRERVTRGDMLVSHIPSSNQLADIFTKGLHTSQFSYLRNNLMLSPPSISLRGDVSLQPKPPE